MSVYQSSTCPGPTSPDRVSRYVVSSPPFPEPGTQQPDLAERLAHSINEVARLTGLSRDLLYDQMRRGNLASIKVGRRRLITRQHLQQFLEIAS
jgi:excisionase family DNA binding protein